VEGWVKKPRAPDLQDPPRDHIGGKNEAHTAGRSKPLDDERKQLILHSEKNGGGGEGGGPVNANRRAFLTSIRKIGDYPPMGKEGQGRGVGKGWVGGDCLFCANRKGVLFSKKRRPQKAPYTKIT